MDAADQPSGQQDPQRNPCTGVSPKPVDFYPDPGRRPYGFVLQNGEDLRRGSGSTWDTDGRGISFVSDQPVYIWGDFNLHSTDGTTANLIEEFTDPLTASSWANFYTRATLNTNFARPASDTWRASEVIADLVYVLSDAFIPGYVADGITWNSNAAGSSSYGNMPLLESDAGVAQGGIKNWMRENGNGSDVDTASPIKLSHRGFPFFLDGGVVREYGTNLPTAATDQNFEPIGDTARAARIDFTNLTHYVNTVVIGAIPPARVNQPYGELTNHLRFIENWDGSTLNFKGSLAQFTFSTYSGPHDQDSWEPGTQATGTSLTYYGAPSREWGFDVGLLYNPPGAIAQRLSVPSKVRSEFYREPAVDDAYIMNLRCAWVDSDGSGILETYEQGDTNRVDSRLTATECPAP